MDAHNTLYIKTKWETELQQDISQETWKEICSEVHRVTCSNNWRELKWKMVVRYFRAPHITGRSGTSATSGRWRNYRETDSNFIHTFWSCKKLKKYWDNVYLALYDIFKIRIPQGPLTALLGVVPEHGSMDSADRAGPVSVNHVHTWRYGLGGNCRIIHICCINRLPGICYCFVIYVAKWRYRLLLRLYEYLSKPVCCQCVVNVHCFFKSLCLSMMSSTPYL